MSAVEELAAAARSGDRAAFDELVVRLRPQLVAFLARRVAASDAEDVAQETFLRAFDRLDSYDPGRPFGTWLFAIGKNVAANHAVARTRREAREAAVAPVSEAAPEAASRDAADELWARAARVLKPEPYRALYLSYAEGKTIAAIATTLGRSQISVKVMLFRARRRLMEVR
ncbi:MAG TPA: RNA polymerase sigma factor [Kofleriaceae bacterium]